MTTVSRVSLERFGFAFRTTPSTTTFLGSTWTGTTTVNSRGSALGLSTDASGAAITADRTEAEVKSYAIGMGDSSAFATAPTAVKGQILSSTLTLNAGGGQVDASASATSEAVANGRTLSVARAVNVGVANVRWFDRVGQTLQLGSTAAPFLAESAASAGNIGLDPSAASFPDASAVLESLATSIGFDGSGSGTTSPGNAIFAGQPNAVVAATASLDISNVDVRVDASGTATTTAIGIRDYTIAPTVPLPLAPTSLVAPSALPSASTQISGVATTRLSVRGRSATAVVPATTQIQLAGEARGIQAATIRTQAAGDATIQGSALAAVGRDGSSSPTGITLNGLTAYGINGSTITGGSSNTDISGSAGMVVDPSLATSGSFDQAGISDTQILLANGNDSIVGTLYSVDQLATQLGLSAAEVQAANAFLATQLVDASDAPFAGLRRVYASLGRGDNSVSGSSLDSSFNATAGTNSFSFDRAKGSLVLGGRDTDTVRVSEVSVANGFITADGDDAILLLDASGTPIPGDGNTLIPGRGQDRVANGAGYNTIDQSGYLAATEAASSPALAASLATAASGSFWSSLSTPQKALLWEQGLITDASGVIGKVDAITGFKPGVSGSQQDTLVLNAGLTKVSNAMWANPATTALHVWTGSSWQKQEGYGPLGILVGPSAQILSLGFGSPFAAYATDTRQLMYDPDGNWSNGGAQSMGSLSLTGNPTTLTKANFTFASSTL